jgi:tetratricopeptide (TPR) repeat protein
MRSHRLKEILIAWVACALLSSAATLSQSDENALFNSAMQLYQQNQFRSALDKFKQVSGSNTPEAKSYISKINTYVEAWTVATTVLKRSPDERDARSLEYAIEELQVAISIKPDGPGNPGELIAQARQLKLQAEKGGGSNSVETGLCGRALAAAAEHNFKEASQLSCILANDNPAYSCGGNEAVYLCQQNRELAKEIKEPVQKEIKEPVQPTSLTNNDFEKAKAAYDKNDFERARSLFQQMSGEAKPEVGEYLDKITRYSDSVSSGERLSRAGQYAEAQAQFLSAAGIKPDGPGDPQNRAATMELFLGLDQFYSGDYTSATQHLEASAKANTGKPALVHFYLGASKLARFFVTGSQDSALQQDALNDLKQAKQEGFKPASDVSPRILDTYKSL